MHISQPVSTKIADAFIRRNPTKTSPIHRSYVSTENGGRRWVVDSEGPEETVRFVPSTTTTEQHAIRTTPDGRTVNPGWNVVCSVGTSIKIGDLVPRDDGTTVEIIYESNTPSWRRVFEAIEYDG